MIPGTNQGSAVGKTTTLEHPQTEVIVSTRQPDPQTRVRNARRLLDNAHGDPSRLKDALLSYHGALEAYMRWWLSSKPELPRDVREAAPKRDLTNHRTLLELISRYGGLGAYESRMLDDFNRIRNAAAHGAPYEEPQRNLEEYARTVEAIVAGKVLRTAATRPAPSSGPSATTSVRRKPADAESARQRDIPPPRPASNPWEQGANPRPATQPRATHQPPPAPQPGQDGQPPPRRSAAQRRPTKAPSLLLRIPEWALWAALIVLIALIVVVLAMSR